MGLLDILNGMQNGPRGTTTPSSGTSGSGSGMSPITMALLGLLAYKAMKHFGGSGATTPGQPNPTPGGNTTTGQSGGPGGMLNDVLGSIFSGKTGGFSGLPGGLGGLVAGGAAGGILSNCLGGLIKDLQNSGQGNTAQSWIGTGSNQQIEPDDLGKALGADTINTLSQQTGLSRDDLLKQLSEQLPQMVDKLTPEGRLPTEQEAAHW